MKQSSSMFLRAVLGAALFLPAASAIADEAAVPEPVGKLTPPPGWAVDVGRSAARELAVTSQDHFGGARVHVSAQHLYAPTPGGLLLVTEVATESLPADPAAVATTELHATRSDLDALGDTVKVARWDIKADEAARTTEGKLEWSDASLGTTTIGRTLLFQTGGHLVRLDAECIIANDAAALRGPCEQALATLAPLAAVADRQPLAVSAVAPPVAVPPTMGGDIAPPRPDGEIPRNTGPTIGERSDALPATIDVKPPAKKQDRRPYYVGGGLVLLAAAYLWNKRNRERAAPPVAKDDAAKDDAAKDDAAKDDEERA